MQRNSRFEQREYGQLFTPKGNKFVIGTVSGDALEIIAQYNPKELSRTASATWTPHPNTSAKQSNSNDNLVWMEYGTTEPRSVTLELLFDGYEEGISVANLVRDLESLTLPRDMGSVNPHHRHPQLCVAVWGSQQMRCVVMSVGTKLTMFDATGEPLRATCSVTLKEVDVVAMMDAGAAKGYDTRMAELNKTSGPDTSARRRHWKDDPEMVAYQQREEQRRAKAASTAKSTAPEPAPWTPPPEKPTGKRAPVAPVAPLEAEDDQDIADDQALAAQNARDRKDDDAEDADAAAAAPKPTATVPEGTYEVGTPSQKVDPNTLEGSPKTVGVPSQPLDPDTLESSDGAPKTVGVPSSPVDPNTLEDSPKPVATSEPDSKPVPQDVLDDME